MYPHSEPTQCSPHSASPQCYLQEELRRLEYAVPEPRPEHLSFVEGITTVHPEGRRSGDRRPVRPMAAPHSLGKRERRELAVLQARRRQPVRQPVRQQHSTG